MGVIQVDYEVIVKYNGNILRLENELNVSVEILSPTYAIITSSDPNEFDKLLEYSEIEYVEKPFILVTQDTQSFSSTGITSFKGRTNLSGRGTIIGLIDSGIDYTLPIFKDQNNRSKILYYWDQSITGTPPEGFKEGTLYTNEDINMALNGEKNIPISITAAHGTHVAGIAAGIANDANLIVVRVGNRQTDYYSRSTEFMRAIKFILDTAVSLNMPVAINISYGSNEGSHLGLSLFEQYIDDMCLYWKNNIIVAAGNNANRGGHQRIQLENNVNQEVEFTIGQNERIINLNIWPDFTDEFTLQIISPSNEQSQVLSEQSPKIINTMGSTSVVGNFYPIEPYSLARRITIQFTGNPYINSGIWRLRFEPRNIVNGRVQMYLPTAEGISKDTRFLFPTSTLTVTVPGTAPRVITVGSFNSRTDTVSVFSGRGDIDLGVYKPDILAPGEDIISYLPGGSTGSLTGTSMATPHVTGVCSLLMQWGIADRNDPFMYSQRLKALLIDNARRREGVRYPTNETGYGFLDLTNMQLISTSQSELDSLYRGNIINNIKGNMSRQMQSHLERVFIIFNDGFIEETRRLNIEDKFEQVSFNTGILTTTGIEYNFLIRLFQSPYIIRSVNLVGMVPFGEASSGVEGGIVANEEIGVNFIKNNPNLNISGRGVLICIADSGIDYLHEDFINADGTSKILYIWDQSKDGNPPEGFYIGTEYTNEDINNAIRNNDNSLVTDEVGTGTLISGICAGLGRGNRQYEGVAPGAELIIVKLKKEDGFTQNIYLYAARQYAIRKSNELNMPIIFNISVGSNFLAGYIRGIVENEISFLHGYCEVAAVGNEGNTETHTSGIISNKGEIQEIEFEITKTEDELQLDLWVERPDEINVKIVSPTGEESKSLNIGYYVVVDGLFNFENTTYNVNFVYPTTYSGQQLAQISLRNATPGIWKLRLEGNFITSGRYNIYMNNRAYLQEGTRFVEPDPSYTINYPAVQRYLISVGAYDLKNRNIWPSSSRGPNIQDDMNPVLVAPGVDIIGPYPQNTYGRLTGTSAAAAYVSGVAALFYQYTIVDGRYPQYGFLQDVNAFLQLGATRSNDIVYPNTSYGFGILNARGMFDQFR